VEPGIGERLLSLRISQKLKMLS